MQKRKLAAPETKLKTLVSCFCSLRSWRRLIFLKAARRRIFSFPLKNTKYRRLLRRLASATRMLLNARTRSLGPDSAVRLGESSTRFLSVFCHSQFLSLVPSAVWQNVDAICYKFNLNRRIKEILLKKVREKPPDISPWTAQWFEQTTILNKNGPKLARFCLHAASSSRSLVLVACSRLSDSGEDARKWNTGEKLAGRKKGKREGICSRFIFVFALSPFSGPDYLGAWKRLWFWGKDSKQWSCREMSAVSQARLGRGFAFPFNNV